MARPKSIIKTCSFQVAKRQRKCGQDKKHIIAAGERCLAFREQMKEKSYCLACARTILRRGKEEIEALMSEL